MHDKKLKINFVRFVIDSELLKRSVGAQHLINVKGSAAKKV